MEMQCKKCGSANTVLADAKQFASRTGQLGVAGFIDPTTLAEILAAIVAAIGAVLTYLGLKEKNKKLILVCQNCGWWEKI